MWPYTDDEAGWLAPPERGARPARAFVNDNDPLRGPSRVVPLGSSPQPPAAPAERKPDREA